MPLEQYKGGQPATSNWISQFFLAWCICFSAAALANNQAVTETSERFNPDSPAQGSGWAQMFDPSINDLLQLPYVKIDGMAIYEGDIVLGNVAEFEPSQNATSPVQQSVAIRSIRRRWIDAIVPYVVDSSFSASQATRIRDAMDHIEASTSARFVQRLGQSDYVSILKTGGCSSFIGRRGGAQSLNLGGGCANSLGVIVHELYHALGMFHEQSRSDRDNFVTINFANIQSGFENNFEKANNAIDVEIGPYDYDSVMHYGRFTFSRNGLETISVPGNQSIGNRSGLSDGDIAGMQYIYYTDLNLGLSIPAQVNPGAAISVTMNVANEGDTDIGDIIAKDLKLTLPLPGNSGYRGFSSSQAWQCGLQGRSVECTLKWLNRSANTDLVVNLIAATDLSTMQLSPTVSASNRDPRTGNNGASARIIVNNDADLAVSIAIPKTEIAIGERTQARLNFTNIGPVDTGQVNLHLDATGELEFEGYSGTGWTCSNARTTIGCELNNLAAAATSKLTIAFTAKSVISSAEIEATVTTQATDSNISNNTAKAAVKISQLPTDNTESDSSGSSSSGAGATDLFALISLCLLGLGRYIRRMRFQDRSWSIKFGCLSTAIWLGGCQVPSGEMPRILYVDSKMAACTGVMPRQCLRVKHPDGTDWEYFYSDIHGFKFEPGYRYKLSVVTREREDTPQDVSSLEYELVEVLEKNCVVCE